MGAREIAKALGRPEREGRNNWRCLCPVHGGHSLSVADGTTQLIVKCWAGCYRLDVLAAIRDLDLDDDDDWQSETREEHHQHTELALRGWQRGRDGRVLKPYLRSRGITL